MRHYSKLASMMLLLFAASIAGAQSPEIQNKVHFENTQDLPNGVAFQVTLDVLTNMASQGERATAVEWIQAELNMSASEASALLEQLLVTRQAMVEEAQRAIAKHACSIGEPYRLLDELYYVEESVYDRYYEETMSAVDAATGALLEKWISRQKDNIVHSHVDFEKVDEASGTDSTKTLSMLCQNRRQ